MILLNDYGFLSNYYKNSKSWSKIKFYYQSNCQPKIESWCWSFFNSDPCCWYVSDNIFKSLSAWF